MRLSLIVCLVLAVILVVLGLLDMAGPPIGLFIAAGLILVLGLWLGQQPKRDDQGADEGKPE